MGTQLEVVVGGWWQSMGTLPGDIQMDTIWPGGSDQLTWTPGIQPARRLTGGMDVRAFYGGACVWAGTLAEPDASQEELSATGAFRDAAGFVALDGSGNATATPDTAVDQAIARGLNWTRPATIRSTPVAAIDISQGPVGLTDLLNTYTTNNTLRWGVNPRREVYAQSDDTAPTWQTLPIAGGLGYALDDYASTLIGRYLDSSDSTYKTATVTDSNAETLHGHVEDVVDLTTLGPISSTAATNRLTSLLALGRATPAWTSPLSFSYGEILTMGGAAVALETVHAGPILRVQSGYELAQRLNGAMYLDVPIGRTSLSGGTLTIQPAQLAVRTLADAITAALSKKRH